MNRPGNVVTIYQKPMQGSGLEGRAALLKKLSADPTCEFWIVKMCETRLVCKRWIKKAG